MMGRILRQRAEKSNEHVQNPKVKRSRAEIQKAYRQRIKEDAEQYAVYLAKERVRAQRNRASMSEEQRESSKKLAAIRAQRFRDRQRAFGSPSPGPRRGILTKAQKVTLREKWRLDKQKWRLKINIQKQRRVRERESNMKRLRRLAKEHREKVSEKRKNISSLQRKLDEVLYKGSSPTDENSLTVLLQRALQSSLYRTRKEKEQRRQIIQTISPAFSSLRQARKCLGLGQKVLETIKGKHNDMSKAVTDKALKRKTVRAFYISNDASQQLGGVRGVDKNGNAVRFLKDTLPATYAKFCRKYPASSLGFSSFAKLRPSYIRLCHSQPKNQSLCERCENFKLLFASVKTALVLPDTIGSRQQLIAESLCKKTGSFNKLDCVTRNCNSCGTMRLQKMLKGLVTDERQSVSFSRWERVKLGTSSMMKLTTKQEPIGSVIDLVIADVHAIAEHLFVADWQFDAFKTQKSILNDRECLQVLDFSQNYLCVYQDEAQGAHWNHNQVTVHPVVSYYKCPCGDTIREESIILSDDLQHDAHAVNAFENAVEKHLKEVRGVELGKMVQYTDGAAAQYKGITAFSYLAKKPLPTTRNFFGSRHGKGPCDTAGGVVKNAARRAVMSRKCVIRDLNDMFDFCSKNLTVGEFDKNDECKGTHMRRTFFKITEIQRPTKDTALNLRPIKGTRKVHSITNINSETKEVEIRNLTCLCEGCLSKGESECEHKEQVQAQQYVTLTKAPKHNKLSKIASSQTREEYFKTVQARFVSCQSFPALLHICSSEDVKIRSFEIPVEQFNNRNVFELRAIIDGHAQKLVPSDLPSDVPLYPVQIYGDGNCLSRVGSLLAFGNEERHTEIRVRVIHELVLNSAFYLDDDNLSKGHEQRSDYSLNYAGCSPAFRGQKIKESPTGILSVFQDEILMVTKDGAYQGMWQLMALASILGARVFSAYPMMGYNVRRDYNRWISPREERTSSVHYILWSSVFRGKAIDPLQWYPDHFVPLLPMHALSQCETDLMNGEEDDNEFTGLSNHQVEVIDDIVIKSMDNQEDFPIEGVKAMYTFEEVLNKYRTTSDLQPALSLQDGEFIMARVQTEKGAKPREFLAKVLCEESDDEDDVPTGRGWAVSFLREKGNGVYVFPDVPDEAFVTVTDVVRKVEVAVTRRGVKISSQ